MRKFWLVLQISLLVSCSTFLIHKSFSYAHANDKPDSSSQQRIETNSRLIAGIPPILDDILKGARGSADNFDDMLTRLRGVAPDLSSAIRYLKYYRKPNVQNSSRLQRIVNTLFKEDYNCYGIVTCSILLERRSGNFGENHRIGRQADEQLTALINEGSLTRADLNTARDLKSEIETAFSCCSLPTPRPR